MDYTKLILNDFPGLAFVNFGEPILGTQVIEKLGTVSPALLSEFCGQIVEPKVRLHEYPEFSERGYAEGVTVVAGLTSRLVNPFGGLSVMSYETGGDELVASCLDDDECPWPSTAWFLVKIKAQ